MGSAFSYYPFVLNTLRTHDVVDTSIALLLREKILGFVVY